MSPLQPDISDTPCTTRSPRKTYWANSTSDAVAPMFSSPLSAHALGEPGPSPRVLAQQVPTAATQLCDRQGGKPSKKENRLAQPTGPIGVG